MDFTAVKNLFATDHGNTAVFACDVHRDSISFYSRIGEDELEEAFPNKTWRIERELRRFKKKATTAGMKDILLVAEPTGPYHNKLMRTAKRVGLKTAWVSTEFVSKMRVIESNDTGKTDEKDPRVIHTLARVGKTLKNRILEEPYSLLREWHKIYDAADRGACKAKNGIQKLLVVIFPDYDFQKDFVFTRSGRALMKRYGCNPHRIVRSGQKRFFAVMRKETPRIRRSSLERLFRTATTSSQKGEPEDLSKVWECRLAQLFEDLNLNEKRKEAARKEMENLYMLARRLDPRLPDERKGVITRFHLARIVAETGPLSDFPRGRQLLRFSGHNLRERKSGKFVGETKMSKKGRKLLRKVMGFIVLPLVKKHGLFGDYYRGLKARNMKGAKALVAVARRFLKMLHGWYRAGGAFDRDRVFVCESQYKKAA
jgi:transposase